MLALILIALSLSFLCGITCALSPTALVAMSPLGLVGLLILDGFWRKGTARILPVTSVLLAMLLAGALGDWRGLTPAPAALSSATAVVGVVAGEPRVLPPSRVDLPLKVSAACFPGGGWQSIEQAMVTLRMITPPSP